MGRPLRSDDRRCVQRPDAGVAVRRLRAGRIFTVLCALAGALIPADASAIPPEQAKRQISLKATAAVTDYHEMRRTHRIGNIGLSITNWGQFGNSGRLGGSDYCTGQPSESFEFPLGSGIDYLGVGSLWIGAIRNTDTLVSIATDGWEGFTEFFPRPVPDGVIIERTSRPELRNDIATGRCSNVLFSEDAVSEQDLITYYYDTVTNARFVWQDRHETRTHMPIGFEIEQKSYSWSFDYAKDFVLMEMNLRNLLGATIQDLYIGVFMDYDVGHYRLTWGSNWDDITGFIRTVPSTLIPGLLDTVNIAWTADNNGDPGRTGQFVNYSATGIAGVRVLKAPSDDLRFSFNWWASNSVASRDWGPNKRDSRVQYTRGNLGTPLGDAVRYQMMANGEFDYDQIESAIDHQADGWLPPPKDALLAIDLANGYDTRFMLSFGPFDVKADSTLSLTIALVAGANLHTDGWNFGRYFDPARPDLFRDHLDFSDLLRNARWASWVYDTPGFDTDGDGYRGEFRIVGRDTIFFRGDGIPDFKGPPPPPAPELRFETFAGKLVVRWNGFESETTIDYFSNVIDFEGYRVYMSRTGRLEDFAMLSQRDRINYIRYQYRPSWDRWTVEGLPLDLDSLQVMYDDLADSVYNFRPFHPDSFTVASTDDALRVVVLDEFDRARLDTVHYYFEPYNANDKINDTTAATLADCCSADVIGVIRKRFPFATPADTIWENGIAYPAYYEYEYAIDGLHVAEPVSIAVTAFDFGDPVVGLGPLETSPLVNAREVWPVNSAEVVKSDRPKPGVYPNPYRSLDGYNAGGWEDRGREGLDPERARKVTFTNVPDTCTVSIWSLDGDLVRRLDHAEHPSSPEATVVVWNLITRNTQAIKTGIYIWTIESRFGTDVGKLVIIK